MSVCLSPGKATVYLGLVVVFRWMEMKGGKTQIPSYRTTQKMNRKNTSPPFFAFLKVVFDAIGTLCVLVQCVFIFIYVCVLALVMCRSPSVLLYIYLTLSSTCLCVPQWSCRGSVSLIINGVICVCFFLNWQPTVYVGNILKYQRNRVHFFSSHVLLLLKFLLSSRTSPSNKQNT